MVKELRGPVALAQGPGNLIYVTEIAAGAVSQIDVVSGARKVVADGLAGPEGIDVGPDGLLYVAEVGQKRVVAIDPATGDQDGDRLQPRYRPGALSRRAAGAGADRRRGRHDRHGLCQLRHPQRALQADAAPRA